MLLVVTYSTAARTSLRNVCRTHEESVIRRFGRAALLADTHHGAFLALRLREKHPDDVQLERTEPFNEFRDLPASVREAAEAYENRTEPATAYAKFAVDSPHPSPDELKRQEL
ncbi:uncharacterized protein NP_5102A [Natronomonas pharaonis DSM 2160]|uniref:Uncharacterized protein n=1 Tax=Natronomonas pharaonis (strain ATCC 35678 / DSM 2160 / CIP 103997 / JCM 8858 / NBRC 14720 / NCIMB 2260 / Gabara) TaxID=348780 RepID=A0A1U7EZD1_NATPD|nr:hypothetical protein [Natronomonas pharaonis]CAI50642.1 uncharacterized protein NP_5102A [Natronomonas pharaonis DSM 2160]